MYMYGGSFGWSVILFEQWLKNQPQSCLKRVSNEQMYTNHDDTRFVIQRAEELCEYGWLFLPNHDHEKGGGVKNLKGSITTRKIP